MAIARKPRRPSPAGANVDALIEKGGSAAGDRARKDEQAAVPLRLPRALLARVDRAVAAERLPTPRNTWILQALLEKLERDGIT